MSQPLTQPNGYNTSNMMFSDPKTSSIPTKKGQPITYQRINITTKGKKRTYFSNTKCIFIRPIRKYRSYIWTCYWLCFTICSL